MKTPVDQILTKPQLAARWGISLKSLERRVKDSGVPFIRLGPKAQVFRLQDIERWEAERVKVIRPDEPKSPTQAKPAAQVVIPGWDGVIRSGKRGPRK